MARPHTWHRRLSEMHRQVSESPRTPYTVGELARLFRVGREATKKLVQLMPRTVQGNAAVVEREHLLAWIAACTDAEDLGTHLAALRRDPPRPSRRKLRLFVPGNFVRGELRPLSAHQIFLKRGHLEIDYTTLEDLHSKLLVLAGSIEDPAFERRYCQPPDPQPLPQRSPQRQAETEDLTYIKMFRKLCRIADAMAQASAAGDRSRARRLQKVEAALYARLETFCASTGRVIDDVTANAHRLLQGEDVDTVITRSASPTTCG